MCDMCRVRGGIVFVRGGGCLGGRRRFVLDVGYVRDLNINVLM